jgi:magnesium transporter
MTKASGMLADVPLDQLPPSQEIEWYWADFVSPTDDETNLLRTHFRFHELSIEDCLEHLERPKLDYYESYHFFVTHALDQDALEPIEVDFFVGGNYLVSFCKRDLPEVELTRKKVLAGSSQLQQGPVYIAHLILDKIVDCYFPVVYRLEDSLDEINREITAGRMDRLIDRVFEIRTDLLKMRHIVNSMKELLYRTVSSGRLEGFRGYERKFSDIYDHLLKLSDIIDSNREMTADIRENYVSINSHRMNRIMTFFTVITSVFIPLTFIVGVYGMNFDVMPELRWKYGYFCVLGLMVLIGILLLLWFKRKGWFDIKK